MLISLSSLSRFSLVSPSLSRFSLVSLLSIDRASSCLNYLSSLKEQRMLCTWMCFVCLHTAHGVITGVSNAGHLPQLVPDQALKLRQLTVLTLAETNKILPYDQLMHELDVANVRELEDFLINECMYAGIVRGKLDQLRKCFEVQLLQGEIQDLSNLGV